MNADHAYVIGDSHKVCEDYARSGIIKRGDSSDFDLAYAILSDGCSSSPDTDIGARILVHSAKQVLERRGEFRSKEHVVQAIVQASSVQKLMNIKEEALDSTLLSLTCHYVGGKAYLNWGMVCGDGVVAICGGNRYTIYDIEYKSGYPLYVSYTLDDVRSGELANIDANFNIATIRKFDVVGDQFYDDTFTCSDFPLNVGNWLSYEDFCYDWDSIAVFSDGVKSFLDEDRKPVDFREVVQELMSFKGFKGQFVGRRMQAFLKQCKKRGWTHYDDLSMAAVYLGEQRNDK